MVLHGIKFRHLFFFFFPINTLHPEQSTHDTLLLPINHAHLPVFVQLPQLDVTLDVLPKVFVVESTSLLTLIQVVPNVRRLKA